MRPAGPLNITSGIVAPLWAEKIRTPEPLRAAGQYLAR
jgi:hypothetical protein